MKNAIYYILILIFWSGGSCTPLEEETQWISQSFSCGVLSSEVTGYINEEITLKVRFFILDKEESDQLTKRSIENSLIIQSSDVISSLLDFREVTTPYSGNYSCGVLIDEIFNLYSYDTGEKFSITDVFLRKYLKNAGADNSFLISGFKKNTPPVSFISTGYTTKVQELDLPIAEILNNVIRPTQRLDSIPLLESIDILLEKIKQSAPPENKNLLILYSGNKYYHNNIVKDSIISKALREGTRVSTIMNAGGDYYVNYDLNNEDIIYKLAIETGGLIYKSSDYLGGKDLYILASRLGNIFEGNFRCFESTWKIVPYDKSTDPFIPGFFLKTELQVELQTGYDNNTFSLPFGIYIR